MSQLNPNDVYEKFISAGSEWARLDGEASKLEQMVKTVKAQIMTSYGAISISKSEMQAYTDQAYISHVEKMIEARTKANIAKAKFDAIKVWVDMTRTIESSRRAEMNLR